MTTIISDSVFNENRSALDYAIIHVYFPVQVPEDDDYTIQNHHLLARAVCEASRAYSAKIDDSLKPEWRCISKMLDNLQASVFSEHLDKGRVISQLSGMQAGDILTFLVRATNAAVVFRKQESCTLYESFEVSPREDAVKKTTGSLVCAYPGLVAVEVPNTVIDDNDFRAELANFLTHSDAAGANLPNLPSAHSQYITVLLTGILRAVGRLADVPRVTKRIRDEVGQWRGMTSDKGVNVTWRRSSLWLLIRVTIQTSLDRSASGRSIYKVFMLFFMCTLATEAHSADVSGDLLHLISAKLLRRLKKLGTTAPSWLSDMVIKTCTRLQDTLDARWATLQVAKPPPPPWNPSQLNLTEDTRLSLLHSRDYLRNALANPGKKLARTRMHPKDHVRGTLENFLCSDGTFFTDAWRANPYVALFDVERSIEEDLDDWVCCITDVPRACAQLEILMDNYLSYAHRAAGNIHDNTGEHHSIMLLTALELWIALDRLAVWSIPILADYSPEVPMVFLEKLLLRKTTNLRRLSRAFMYLSSRHSMSHPEWSVLADEFTENSFPVRYYESAPNPQLLNICVDTEGTQPSVSRMDRPRDQHDQCQIDGQLGIGDLETSGPALPSESLYAKVVAFELQCPAVVQIWRSATVRLLYYFDPIDSYGKDRRKSKRNGHLVFLSDIPELRPYIAEHSTQRLSPVVQFRLANLCPEAGEDETTKAASLYTGPSKGYPSSTPPLGSVSRTSSSIANRPPPQSFMRALLYRLSYSASNPSRPALPGPQSLTLHTHNKQSQWRGAQLRYTFELNPPADGVEGVELCEWRHSKRLCEPQLSRKFMHDFWAFKYGIGRDTNLEAYFRGTTHTPNMVLSAQWICPMDHSVDEYVAFGHLRSGGSLQWINILRELRGRTLNLRRDHFHFLLAHAACQVGPLESNSGTWIWHSELQELSFCNALLHELESLFADLAAGSLDGVAMNTASFLVTRLLTSSPCEDVSKRAIGLLRNIRRKTFAWVKELSYDLSKDPMNHDRRKLLRDMAATCRSTCDVDPVTLRKIVFSADDVDAVVSCGIFIHATSPTCPSHLPKYSRLLLERDRRLAPALELVLRETILADVSNQGIDLAVRNVWPDYRPGFKRWEPVQDPTSHRLVCWTAIIGDRGCQTVQVDLLDGSLLVDGQLIGGMPPEIRQHTIYLQIFQKESFFVVPSDLPGMDFVTLAMVLGHRVHFSLRGEDLIIQAQPCDTDDIFQLVPREKLKGDLPAILVERHVHWLNILTGTIEICPLEHLWEHSPENWKITYTAGKYHMCQGQAVLADIQSPTWAMVSSRMQYLELPENLIVAASTNNSDSNLLAPQLSVTLPRYNLSFFVNEDGDLESRDFERMVYDNDQCAGTLFGLQNQLVLRSKVSVEGLVAKCIIIPRGLCQLSGDTPFDPKKSLKPVEYHAYEVDTELGCLTGNASLRSKLYQVELHELTSIDWRVDPLTGRTGAQEAFCLVQSAGCQSLTQCLGWRFDPLGQICSWHRHPQIDIAVDLYHQQEFGHRNRARSSWLKRGAKRGIYLFQSDPTTTSSSWSISEEESSDADYAPLEPDLELKNILYSTASVVYGSCVDSDLPVVEALSQWAEMWGPGDLDSPTQGEINSLPQSHRAHWTRQVPPATAIEIQEILKNYKIAYWQFQILFLFPTLAYFSSSPQAAFLSLHTALANSSKDISCVFRGKTQLTTPRCLPAPLLYMFERRPWKITLQQLLHSRAAPELPVRSTINLLPCPDSENSSQSSQDTPVLHQLFIPLRVESGPAFQREYMSRLHISAEHVRSGSYSTKNLITNLLTEILERSFLQCRGKYLESLDILRQCLGPTAEPLERVLDRSCQWPRITADTLLRCLASTSSIELTGSWKKCLVSLALLLLDLQHARRLLQFALAGLEEELSDELNNGGCDEQFVETHPDWLLIQIQGNFRIRRRQAEIAQKIVSPPSGENTLMQVNMGEGKSSVIIPISGAALADGSRLVRVVVPKTLTVQMADRLINCMGGIANRKIYYLPFSRPHCDSEALMDQIHRQMSQCMNERGILLAQPEHILSLKLAILNNQLSNDRVTARRSQKNQRLNYERSASILSLKSFAEGSHLETLCRSFRRSLNHWTKSQKGVSDEGHENNALKIASKSSELLQWLHSHARDILDESDEILHSRNQLIYAIGHQEHLDGYPDRWTTTQQVLRLVRNHISSLANDIPGTIEYEPGPPGSFPHVRILQGSDAGQRLIALILEDVMAGRLPNVRFRCTDPALHLAIRSFISCEHVDPETVKKVEMYVQESQQSGLLDGLLLLRGFLACNILLFVLMERRWRVDYGLLPSESRNAREQGETRLAVPYRAKDTPTRGTQFGHPDVTIFLTCLSYYYTGLDKEELKASFEVLLDQDNPTLEFASWVEDCKSGSVPDSLQRLRDVSLQSSEQWDKHIFPLFTRNQGAINFYLSRVVFPKEAKEFPWKLSASSWDLAEKRDQLVTGFSGTADGRYLLPMSISHHDLEHQQETNARVLSCLLQPENNFYMLTAKENGGRLTTREFLEVVVAQKPEIRVLLDIGAQILDLSNKDVAKAWLSLAAADIAGVIYFEGDELMLLTKNGTSRLFISSPLAQQLGRCIAYLDHAHTRGTDIKFPKGFRAAVTLGPKVTKDHLVQGCMRMRKLGRGHSVMFFAPPEVDRNIRFVAVKDENIAVTTADILYWAIRETWTDIQQRAYHWARQGTSHKSRYDAWTRFCRNELTAEKLSEIWLQPEIKPLTELYAPHESKDISDPLDPDIQQRCLYMGGVRSYSPHASLDEEQERQVSRQLEREREVELAPKAEAAEHSLHPDVIEFVKTGLLPSLFTTAAFRPIFTTLEKSSAATRESQVWSPYIVATEDFCNTIIPTSTQGRLDQYLRPVQWILSGHTASRDRDRVLVLLSPFEVDRLLPAIRVSEHVHLHLYLPRTSEQMKPSDDLKFYAIPPLPDDWTPPWALIDQLNVFAGQLYLRDYESYRRLSNFLGVPPNTASTPTRRNLFIPGGLEEIENTFVDSPLPCVMTLLNIRRRGLPFAQTHMGRILQGQTLSPEDFKTKTTVASSPDLTSATRRDTTLNSSKRAREEIEGSDTEAPLKRLRVD